MILVDIKVKTNGSTNITTAAKIPGKLLIFIQDSAKVHRAHETINLLTSILAKCSPILKILLLANSVDKGIVD